MHLTVNWWMSARVGINLSATLDQMLSDAIREKKREQWKAENKNGIQALMNSNRKWGYLSMMMNMGLFDVQYTIYRNNLKSKEQHFILLISK